MKAKEEAEKADIISPVATETGILSKQVESMKEEVQELRTRLEEERRRNEQILAEIRSPQKALISQENASMWRDMSSASRSKDKKFPMP